MFFLKAVGSLSLKFRIIVTQNLCRLSCWWTVGITDGALAAQGPLSGAVLLWLCASAENVSIAGLRSAVSNFIIRFFNLVRVLLRHRSLMIKWSVVNQLLPLSRNRAEDDYTDVLWLLVLSVKNDSYTIFHLWRFYTLWLFLRCLFTRTGLREENL